MRLIWKLPWHTMTNRLQMRCLPDLPEKWSELCDHHPFDGWISHLQFKYLNHSQTLCFYWQKVQSHREYIRGRSRTTSFSSGSFVNVTPCIETLTCDCCHSWTLRKQVNSAVVSHSQSNSTGNIILLEISLRKWFSCLNIILLRLGVQNCWTCFEMKHSQ